MNQASIFFRVFDLAFFAPGLVVLLPVWLMTHPAAGTGKLDVVSGVMTAGAWVLLAYALGLFVHALSRLGQPIVDWLTERTRRTAIVGGVMIAAIALVIYGPEWTALKTGMGALALLAALCLGQGVGRWQNPVKSAAEANSLVGLFDRAKQQELGLYFWYMRATSTNIAFAIPLAFAIWVGLGRGRPLSQTQQLLDPTIETVLLCGLGVGIIATFILAAGGRDYHRAWQHARDVLKASEKRADELAEKTATKT